ncbi:Hypothetical protein CINCED_3A012503 [Cinara cedri]|uniref:Uncharacterized protein n=1 Tax=Cinara cedri TaxID=506608 RepID=A0A5E4M2K8_9HEMI|nr:Hypothetical protein CINCED_3A012503 [Cinara cedri]
MEVKKSFENTPLNSKSIKEEMIDGMTFYSSYYEDKSMQIESFKEEISDGSTSYNPYYRDKSKQLGLMHNSKQEGEEIYVHIKKEVDIIEGCVYESEIVIETDPMESILYQESHFEEK